MFPLIRTPAFCARSGFYFHQHDPFGRRCRSYFSFQSFKKIIRVGRENLTGQTIDINQLRPIKYNIFIIKQKKQKPEIALYLVAAAIATFFLIFISKKSTQPLDVPSPQKNYEIEIPLIPAFAPHTVLREQPLKMIDSLFAQPSFDAPFTVAIVGPGLEGKTELAKQYMHQNKDKYYKRFFIQCEHWEKGYKKLAQELYSEEDLSKIENKPIEIVVKAVHDALNNTQLISNKKCLIIFDNAKRDFIREKLKGEWPLNTDLLLTSREINYPASKKLNISDKEYQLTEKEACQILENWIGKKRFDETEAKKICNVFPEPKSPNIMSLVGAYIEKSISQKTPEQQKQNSDGKMEMDEFLPILTNKRGKTSKDTSNVDFEISFQLNMDTFTTQSQNLLTICAYLPGKNIPISLLKILFKILYPLEESDLNYCLNELRPLVIWSNDQVTIHELYQDTISKTKSYSDDECLKLARGTKNFDEGEFIKTDPQKACLMYTKAIQSIEKRWCYDLLKEEWEEIEYAECKEIEYFSTQLGVAYLESIPHKFEDGLKAFEKALKYNRKTLRPSTRNSAELHRKTVDVLMDLDRSQEALKHARLAVEIDEKLDKQSGKHSNTIRSLRALAWCLQKIDDEESLQYYFKAFRMSMSTEFLQKNDASLAKTYQDIGWNFAELAKESKNGTLSNKISNFQTYVDELDSSLKLEEEEKQDLSKAYNDIIGIDRILYQSNINIFDSAQEMTRTLNAFELALKCQEKALVLNRLNVGNRHLYTAKSYCNLGRLLGDLGEYSQAIKFHEHGLKIRVEILGENHELVANCHSNIAWTLQHQGEREKALESYGKAFNIRKAILGKDHYRTKQTIENMQALQQLISNEKRS